MVTEFLSDFDDRLPWKKSVGAVTATEILRGSDETGLTVVVASSAGEPSKADLQGMWKARAGQSADPVLVFVSYVAGGEPRVAVFGPDKDAVPAVGLEPAVSERLALHALGIDSPTGLVAEIRRRLSSLRGGVAPGFRNEGLFASHVLSQQPQRANWGELCTKSDPLLGDRGERLLTGLGYKVETVPDGVVLRAGDGGQRRAAAVLLLDEESFDNPLGRFAGSNAVTHGLALARREGVPWLILLGGSVARLFPADPDVGVGRKGQTQTYVEVDLDLLTGDTAGYLSLLFAPDALVKGGIVEQLLAESTQFATALSDRLRDRIYDDVIPALATAVAARSKAWEVPVEDQKAVLDEAYHQAMVILFRMLFVAYAEDRGLLPLGVNDAYTANALNTLAQRILDDLDKGFSETSTSLWGDLTQIWEVIDTGDLEGMGVPAYNGGLFTQDRRKNPLGAATYKLRLTNSEIGPVIRGLMIDDTPDGYPGLVDFRSLDVREFGTIYEGLLESGLAIADTDLTVDKNDTFIPATKGDDVIVEAGSVYFHSRSGSRKATGSYFTKPFAVQHLLDQALEPALDTHLERIKSLLDKGANKTAAEQLFDFRVADLSMGSAHFLVAAVDRIEARFSAFIADNPMPEVQDELHKLRTTAANQLGLEPEDAGIDDGLLLRRQIARRCIYGIDLNEIAVELARLAIWIHTFVPGLPLSFLNHGLVHGDSLTGVGTIQEITDSIREAQEREDKGHKGEGIFDINQPLEQLLARADKLLATLATLTGASINEVQQVQDLYHEITEALEPLNALCDLITAERTTRKLKKTDPDKFLLLGGEKNNLTSALTAEDLERAILQHPQLKKARLVARQVNAVHLPTSYPEVFRREPSGFDTIVGNPPWEELVFDAPRFWARHSPGLMAQSVQERDRSIAALSKDRPDLQDLAVEERAALDNARALLQASYPLGTGDADLYKAFAWRFWQVIRENAGRIGVVMPKTAFSAAGMEQWRRDVLADGSMSNITFLTNTARWAFDMEPRYTIALASLTRANESTIGIAGPFNNLQEFIAKANSPIRMPKKSVLSFTSAASVPVVGSQAAADILVQMRTAPPLSDFEDGLVRPVSEFHATNDRKFFDHEGAKATLNVYSGASFNLWEPSTGEMFAQADPAISKAELNTRLQRQLKLKTSAFFGMDFQSDLGGVLPLERPRLAFRGITNPTNTRTAIFSLIPPNTVLTNIAPYLLTPIDYEKDEAFLLGILSSVPFDWYARRFIETQMNFHFVNAFPVPEPSKLKQKGQQWSALVQTMTRNSAGLVATHTELASWSSRVSKGSKALKADDERAAAIAENDAIAAHAYGLTREQVVYVYESFQRGWEYKPRLEAVLEHYDRWAASLSEGA